MTGLAAAAALREVEAVALLRVVAFFGAVAVFVAALGAVAGALLVDLVAAAFLPTVVCFTAAFFVAVAFGVVAFLTGALAVVFFAAAVALAAVLRAVACFVLAAAPDVGFFGALFLGADVAVALVAPLVALPAALDCFFAWAGGLFALVAVEVFFAFAIRSSLPNLDMFFRES